MKKWLPLLALAAFLTATLACSFTPGTATVTQPTATSTFPPLTTAAPVQSQSATVQLITESDLAALYERVNPRVVTVIVTTADASGSGSGFVYDKEGHILTNYHVVEGAETIEVDFTDGNKVYGDVVATDLDSDLAVIKVNVPAEKLVPLPLGDSSALKVGDQVVAIGNPFRLSSTMTLGIVSAKGRMLDSIRTSSDNSPFSAGDLIQTDASINPGNSGGPLLNLAGEVVGINRAIRTTGTTSTGDPVNSGIGFSVSINIVKRVVPYLIRDGQYDYPYLGISSSSLDLSLTEWQALGINQTYGAYLTSVVPGGPADKAGLRAGTVTTTIPGLYAGGDLIQAVDGQTVYVYGDLVSYIMTNKSPGDTINLTIIRSGQTMEVPLTLGKRPQT
jgi:2-alkenal reductase